MGVCVCVGGGGWEKGERDELDMITPLCMHVNVGYSSRFVFNLWIC